MKREEVKGRCKKDRATQIKMKFQIKDKEQKHNRRKEVCKQKRDKIVC